MTGRLGPQRTATTPADAVIDDATRAFLHALGRIVRLGRLHAELTQQQLADRTGMSRSFISLIEHGSHGVDIVRLLRLAAVLRRPLASIVIDAEHRVTDGVPDAPQRALGDPR